MNAECVGFTGFLQEAFDGPASAAWHGFDGFIDELVMHEERIDEIRDGEGGLADECADGWRLSVSAWTDHFDFLERIKKVYGFLRLGLSFFNHGIFGRGGKVEGFTGAFFATDRTNFTNLVGGLAYCFASRFKLTCPPWLWCRRDT